MFKITEEDIREILSYLRSLQEYEPTNEDVARMRRHLEEMLSTS